MDCAVPIPIAIIYIILYTPSEISPICCVHSKKIKMTLEMTDEYEKDLADGRILSGTF